MGRADLSRDQQTAVENHERLLIEEYRSQVGTVEDRYVALIRDALLPG
jgi:hypothetical protein